MSNASSGATQTGNRPVPRTTKIIPLLASLLIAGWIPPPVYASPETVIGKAGDAIPKWSLAVYAGPFTDTRFVEILRFDTEFRSSYVAAVAVGRVLHVHEGYARWEVEGQVARHWGRQNHFETNAALMLRWTRFPWRHRLDTTIAYGLGPSFAWATPRLEAERRDPVSRRLVFMPFEITAAPPGGSPWEAFVRVHHRSGAFGHVSRAGGSNFVTGGVRWRF